MRITFDASLHLTDGFVESTLFSHDVCLRRGRLRGPQLSEERCPRSFINVIARLRTRSRLLLDRPCKQGVIVSHDD